jgi:hypothetical protein
MFAKFCEDDCFLKRGMAMIMVKEANGAINYVTSFGCYQWAEVAEFILSVVKDPFKYNNSYHHSSNSKTGYKSNDC